MRIALTGAHGVGKTTLARALAEKLDLPLITDRARKAAALTGIAQVRELRQDKMKATFFQYTVLVQQLAWEAQNPDGFVSDRSVLDLLAYWSAYGLADNHSYMTLCFNQEYDLLVYVPIEFQLVGDGFRDTELNFQQRVDYLIRQLFTLAFSVRKKITVGGALEERVQAVMDALPGLRRKRRGEKVW
ncbi:MAG: ATP-binding protein [Bacillota bacterium]